MKLTENKNSHKIWPDSIVNVAVKSNLVQRMLIMDQFQIYANGSIKYKVVKIAIILKNFKSLLLMNPKIKV